MLEQQVMLSAGGPIAAPVTHISARAGEASTTPGFRRRLQTSRSLAADEGLVRQGKRMLAHFLEVLRQKASDPDHHMTCRVLINRRKIEGLHSELRTFAGFWGSAVLSHEKTSVFGGSPGSEMVFRCGPWQDWSLPSKQLKSLPKNAPLIFSPYCGTLLHEVVGHGLEEEYLDHSPLAKRMGQRLAINQLRVLDCPGMPHLPGSMAVDDTGRQVSDTALIYDGILVGNLCAENGAKRRASFREPPFVRATNFVINPGNEEPEDWLTMEKELVYITSIRRGHWSPGDYFVRLLCDRVFLLRNGEPVAQAPWWHLTVGVFDLLQRILAVGNDFKFDPTVHWCTKNNQSVPMALGSPSILVAPGKKP